MSEVGELLIGAGAVVVLAIVLSIAYFMDDRRKARRALRRPATPIARVASGQLAKVSGTARGRGTPARTFRGEPCVFVRIEVLHFFRRTGSDGVVTESWRPVAVEEHGGAFELTDETGTAVIEPSGAVWVVEPAWYDVDWNDLSPFEEELVARHAGDVERGHPAKLRQTVILDRQPVSACGLVARGGEDGRPVLRSTAKVPLALGPA